MSAIETVYCSFECDGPGCPSEFSITRHWRESDGDATSEIPTPEMLDYARKLGWKVEGEKAFCPDCERGA